MRRKIKEMRIMYDRDIGLVQVYDDYNYIIKNNLRPIEIKIDTLKLLGVEKSCEFIGQKFVGMLDGLLIDIKNQQS